MPSRRIVGRIQASFAMLEDVVANCVFLTEEGNELPELEDSPELANAYLYRQRDGMPKYWLDFTGVMAENLVLHCYFCSGEPTFYETCYILDLAKNPIIKAELSGIGGIETWRDALEFIQLGCRNVQVCTAVMQYGYRIIDDLILGLQNYMAGRGIDKVEALVGELLPTFYLPHDLDRTTVVYPKVDRSVCIGCGRCAISCADGGHQAIRFDLDTRQPHILGAKCVGCHLCRLVCPAGAIGLSNRVRKS